MSDQSLSAVLARNLVRPRGLTPALGEATRPEVLLDFMARERGMLADTLINIEALAHCLVAYVADYRDGTITADRLAAQVDEIAGLIDAELTYDEAKALSAVV